MNQNSVNKPDEIPEWEPLEEEIKCANEIYRWRIQVNSAGGGKSGLYLLNGMAVFLY